MLDQLVGKLSSEIDVLVNQDYFRFKRQDSEIISRTVVFVSSSGKPRILGIGEDQGITEPSIMVELFKDNTSTIRECSKDKYLEAYFKHCISTVCSRGILVRPTVLFRNSNSLAHILGGYQQYVLENIAIAAGALKCIFQE